MLQRITGVIKQQWMRDMILREENWSVFVRNKFQEIKKLCNTISWRHIPGDRNPADLTSSGCKAKRLVYQDGGRAHSG
ncbi:hypothetical protein TNCV_896671 [Trichonephila clavipes]|nr:hypothetical protein TNCV_896671 [Trichonephila clavipes]